MILLNELEILGVLSINPNPMLLADFIRIDEFLNKRYKTLDTHRHCYYIYFKQLKRNGFITESNYDKQHKLYRITDKGVSFLSQANNLDLVKFIASKVL